MATWAAIRVQTEIGKHTVTSMLSWLLVLSTALLTTVTFMLARTDRQKGSTRHLLGMSLWHHGATPMPLPVRDSYKSSPSAVQKWVHTYCQSDNCWFRNQQLSAPKIPSYPASIITPISSLCIYEPLLAFLVLRSSLFGCVPCGGKS